MFYFFINQHCHPLNFILFKCVVSRLRSYQLFYVSAHLCVCVYTLQYLLITTDSPYIISGALWLPTYLQVQVVIWWMLIGTHLPIMVALLAEIYEEGSGYYDVGGLMYSMNIFI